MFVYVDPHFRLLDDGNFKTHVFIWREGIWRNGKEREVGFYNQKMELTETIGVTLKDGMWCWATDLMVVAEVVCGLNKACVFIRTLYPC
jgi:hypothetical protein